MSRDVYGGYCSLGQKATSKSLNLNLPLARAWSRKKQYKFKYNEPTGERKAISQAVTQIKSFQQNIFFAKKVCIIYFTYFGFAATMATWGGSWRSNSPLP